jgi:hypothetical protein
LLRSLTVGLTLLGAIDAAQSDTFGFVVMQDFYGVAIKDGNEVAGELGKSRNTDKK